MQNKAVNLILAMLLISIFTVTQAAMPRDRTQYTGVGLEATTGSGYGLYAVVMRANESPGAISSFYLYQQNGTFPARWHEIDLEMTPGFTGNGTTQDPNHPRQVIADGNTCYSATTPDNLPQDNSHCHITPVDGAAGNRISFNVFNHRAIDGEPYIHSDAPVFYRPSNSDSIFENFHTYYFYYTPNGVYWSDALPEQKLSQSAPSELPNPVFTKKDFSIVEANPNWQGQLGFEYDAVPLNPKLASGDIIDGGANMKLSMNLWDGTNTDPSHQEDWGGETPPRIGSTSSYKYVAFYPLITPTTEVTNDPTQLQYGDATIFSDFTTSNGYFSLNGHQTTFTELWKPSNGIYLWPLGQLDPRNLSCGHGELTMKISDNYQQPRQNYEKFTDCDWLNQN